MAFASPQDAAAHGVATTFQELAPAAVLLLVTLRTGLLQLTINGVWQVGIVGAPLIAVVLIDRAAAPR